MKSSELIYLRPDTQNRDHKQAQNNFNETVSGL